jgi:hypothetical protein
VLAPGDALVLPGVATGEAPYSTFGVPVGSRRKHIIISNLNTNWDGTPANLENYRLDLAIADTNGNYTFGVFLPPNLPYADETDENVRVSCPLGNADSIEVRVLEHFLI